MNNNSLKIVKLNLSMQWLEEIWSERSCMYKLLKDN